MYYYDVCISDIIKLINCSLDELNKLDSLLLEKQINEPCINHRLAIHIENNLAKYFGHINKMLSVDCEYNKYITTDTINKFIILSESEADEYIYGYSDEKDPKKKEDMRKRSVIPDIIIHKRKEFNLVIIETKKKSNQDEKAKKYDMIKLKRYTNKENKSIYYPIGVYIEFNDEPNDCIYRKHNIKYYLNGKEYELY